MRLGRKFRSSDGKTDIHVLLWIPEGEIRGVLQIAHGMCEFAERYDGFAAFLAEIGGKNKVNEVNLGMLLSTVAIFGAAAICCVSLISNIHTTWNVGIPALVLANQIHPLFASLFAIIIYLGIFSSACPLLWTGIRKVSVDGTTRYKVITVIGGLLGLIVSCVVPYKGILNIIYGLNGYLGFILIAFMIVKDARSLILKKR